MRTDKLKDVDYCKICGEPIGCGLYGLMKYPHLKMKDSRSLDYCVEHDPNIKHNSEVEQ